MVKKNSKSRIRKIDVSDVTSALEKKKEEKKAETKIDGGLFFSVDTKGGSEGLPKSLKKKLNLTKSGVKKGPSAHELKRIERTAQRMKNRANVPKGPAQKESFDLWDPTASDVASARERNLGDKNVDLFKKVADKDAVTILDSPTGFPTTKIQKHLDPEQHKLEQRHKCSFINLTDEKVKKPKNLPKFLGKAQSNAPAVVLPKKSGTSMNPGKEAYTEMVDEVIASELDLQRQEEENLRRTRPMTAKLKDNFTNDEIKAMDETTKVREYRKLMCESNEDGEDSDNDNDGHDKKSGNEKKKVKAGERKTKAQRNKENRVKKSDKEMTAQRRQKLLEKSIGQIPSLVREMQKENAAKREAKEYTNKLKQEALESEKAGIMLKPVKLGRNKFSESVVDLPEKATSSLRAAQHGSAIKDRMQSLHRRKMGELPPEFNRSTLLRVRKKGKRKVRNHKLMQRSLLLA